MNKNLELKVVENSIKLGRPRDNSRDEVIIEATLRQLTLYGYEALSTTEIAKEARVSKATIYRRWPSKRFLVIDAFKTLPKLVIPDTGNFEDDLKDLLAQLNYLFTQTYVLPVLQILTGEMSHDDLLQEELLPWLEERYYPAKAIIERALERGELSKDLDLDIAQSFVVGPLLTMASYSRVSIDEEAIGNLFNIVLEGLGHNPKNPK